MKKEPDVASKASAALSGAAAKGEAGVAPQQPLRDCVREAVERYFTALGDHPTSGLHDLVLTEVEAPLLETVMRHCSNNQSRAALVLGINRSTLRKKLKLYKIKHR